MIAILIFTIIVTLLQLHLLLLVRLYYVSNRHSEEKISDVNRLKPLLLRKKNYVTLKQAGKWVRYDIVVIILLQLLVTMMIIVTQMQLQKKKKRLHLLTHRLLFHCFDLHDQLYYVPPLRHNSCNVCNKRAIHITINMITHID